MHFLLMLFMLCSGFAVAQEADETRFLESHKTVGSPFLLPAHITENGGISLTTKGHSFVVTPVAHVGLKRKTINYVEPIHSDVPEFREIDKSLRWLEVKERAWEGGLGVATQATQGLFMLGLAPYKGATFKTVRLKTNQKNSGSPSWPSKLSHLEHWSVGDQGSYQVYGGLQLLAGLTFGFINVANVSLSVQNQFIVELRKISSRKVVFRLIEEQVKKRIHDIGPMLAKATLAKFKGKRIILEFMLDLTVDEHHQYYKEVIRGNVEFVQKSLSHDEQRLAWEGGDDSYYYGVPWVWGRSHSKGHYVIDEDDDTNELSIESSKNRGILTPVREIQRMAYQTDEGMVMYWSSEMNKTTEARLKKGFLNYARALNLDGLDMELPKKSHIGAVITHLGLGMTKDELMAINNVPLSELESYLQERCEEVQLKCAKERVRRKIMKQVNSLLGKSWEKTRSDLGMLLMREPALLHALIRSLDLKKTVYFKFLSERFQSLEGAAPVVF